MSMSLMSIMRDDPDFGLRLKKKVEEIKNDKANLLTAADDYGKRYQDEIMEGTEKRARLLTEGQARGLSEEQIMEGYGRFIPTVYTPILNLLYFLLRESGETDAELYRQRDRLNEQVGHLQDNSELSENIKDPPKMEEYLYGNITLETFETIKKLKALSRSNNTNEAFAAYRKGLELCKKYNLEFDKIPCRV